MNRSNVGNITTNAVQTLGISGTVLAGLIRRSKSDASSTLNSQRRDEFRNASLAETKANTNYLNAKAIDLQSKAEARNARTAKIRNVNSPQSGEIADKADNDIEWQTMRLGEHNIKGQMIGGIFVPKDNGGAR